MFKLAHLTDLHLGPLPRADSLLDYASKRIIGYGSWRFRRRKLYDDAISRKAVADIKAHAPDHVAFTGDLINIALRLEFENGFRWLQHFGPPDWISFVPGNHDAYVGVPLKAGLGAWAPYMTGDVRIPGSTTGNTEEVTFPFVRVRKNVAIIGASSATPQGYRRAGGTVGHQQLHRLRLALEQLRAKGFFRVLLIHHPPLPGMARPRKALSDAAALRELVEQEGAELILFGHNHEHIRSELVTHHGTSHMLAAPAASARTGSVKPAAAWYLYEIKRADGRWHIDVTVRGLDPATQEFVTQSQFALVN
jgi:3',5'-cyclic AMP phosphodiesterase CpdA